LQVARVLGGSGQVCEKRDKHENCELGAHNRVSPRDDELPGARQQTLAGL
jgi:hypothetical protein